MLPEATPTVFPSSRRVLRCCTKASPGKGLLSMGVTRPQNSSARTTTDLAIAMVAAGSGAHVGITVPDVDREHATRLKSALHTPKEERLVRGKALATAGGMAPASWLQEVERGTSRRHFCGLRHLHCCFMHVHTCTAKGNVGSALSTGCACVAPIGRPLGSCRSEILPYMSSCSQPRAGRGENKPPSP